MGVGGRPPQASRNDQSALETASARAGEDGLPFIILFNSADIN